MPSDDEVTEKVLEDLKTVLTIPNMTIGDYFSSDETGVYDFAPEHVEVLRRNEHYTVGGFILLVVRGADRQISTDFGHLSTLDRRPANHFSMLYDHYQDACS